ncbi:hypothetical protein BC940DRAFT_347103 [Gongronella butleri]|nr:hypothetical protein BC940DRAFT_347103 [Gongronella butleri]
MTAPQTVWDDLLSWQSQIKAVDTKLDKQKPVREQTLPPVRSAKQCILEKQKPLGINDLHKLLPKVADNATAPPAGTGAAWTDESTEKQALQAKEKGNKHFQKQQFQEAIQAYALAIYLDPSNAVYFVNRAMAYLKIQKYAEAESDCTKCLELQPTHVKALWRRGVARKELGRVNDARKDFNRALEIEPENQTIQSELAKLPKDTSPSPPKPKVAEPKQAKSPSSPANGAAKSSSTSSAPKPVTPLSAAQKPLPDQKATPSTSAPAAAPKTTPSTAAKAPPVTGTPPVPQLPPLKLECPRSSYEFTRDWKACARRGNQVLYDYLQCIPPTSFANIFKSSLEPDQFEKMLEVISTFYCKEKSDAEILQVMEGLSKVPRLDMLIMFLDSRHKQYLFTILNKIKDTTPSYQLAPLCQLFSVKLH